MVARGGWEPVETFQHPDRKPQSIDAVDAIAPPDSRRFRSSAGGRAILIRLGSAATGAAALTTSASLPADTEILFLDPGTVEDLSDLLAMLGAGAAAARLALPNGAPSTGLEAEPGHVSVPDGSGGTVEFTLHHRASWNAEQQEKLRHGPKVGESETGIADRSRWFGSRHSGAD